MSTFFFLRPSLFCFDLFLLFCLFCSVSLGPRAPGTLVFFFCFISLGPRAPGSKAPGPGVPGPRALGPRAPGPRVYAFRRKFMPSTRIPCIPQEFHAFRKNSMHCSFQSQQRFLWSQQHFLWSQQHPLWSQQKLLRSQQRLLRIKQQPILAAGWMSRAIDF